MTLRHPRSATRAAAMAEHVARGVDTDDHALGPDPAADPLEAQAGAAPDVQHDVAAAQRQQVDEAAPVGLERRGPRVVRGGVAGVGGLFVGGPPPAGSAGTSTDGAKPGIASEPLEATAAQRASVGVVGPVVARMGRPDDPATPPVCGGADGRNGDASSVTRRRRAAEPLAPPRSVGAPRFHRAVTRELVRAPPCRPPAFARAPSSCRRPGLVRRPGEQHEHVDQRGHQDERPEHQHDRHGHQRRPAPGRLLDGQVRQQQVRVLGHGPADEDRRHGHRRGDPGDRRSGARSAARWRPPRRARTRRSPAARGRSGPRTAAGRRRAARRCPPGRRRPSSRRCPAPGCGTGRRGRRGPPAGRRGRGTPRRGRRRPARRARRRGSRWG